MSESKNTDSPIDFERLQEVCGDDAEMINEIVELYFSQTGEQMNELNRAVSGEDFDAIYKSAHKIAGGSLTCGMNAIVPSIKELEQIGRSKNGENAEKFFGEAQQSFQQMKEYFETNKNELFG